jgi:hypothetical protein
MKSPERMVFNLAVSSEHDVKLEGIFPFETQFECNLVAVCLLSYVEFHYYRLFVLHIFLTFSVNNV